MGDGVVGNGVGEVADGDVDGVGEVADGVVGDGAGEVADVVVGDGVGEFSTASLEMTSVLLPTAS